MAPIIPREVGAKMKTTTTTKSVGVDEWEKASVLMKPSSFSSPTERWVTRRGTKNGQEYFVQASLLLPDVCRVTVGYCTRNSVWTEEEADEEEEEEEEASAEATGASQTCSLRVSLCGERGEMPARHASLSLRAVVLAGGGVPAVAGHLDRDKFARVPKDVRLRLRLHLTTQKWPH